MKKINFLIFAVLAMLWQGCSKNDDNEGSPPGDGVITFISNDNPEFSPAKTESTFSFRSTGPWRITGIKDKANNPVWYKVHPTYGEAGEASILITVNANETFSSRIAEISIASGKNTKTLTISQTERKTFFLTQNQKTVTSDENIIEISVLGNIPYTIEIPDSCKTWIKPAEAKSVEMNTSKFLISKNTELQRQGCIIFKNAGQGLNEKFLITQMRTPVQEQEALVAFYDAANGAEWINKTNWCSNKPVAEWYGVSVNDNGDIIGLDLQSNNLTGAISKRICDFVYLAELNLSYNQLTGTIPAEIGKLASLQSLHLTDNQLSGTIPAEIGNLKSLKNLFLDGNQLTGSIPPEIGKLASLRSLYLGENQLSGTIPAEIGNLTSLKNLFLCDNQLTGTIPAEIGKLVLVINLYLCNNQLSGTIPAELAKITTLRTLYLEKNQLTGSLPEELAEIDHLATLSLNDNQLSGDLQTIGKLSGLRALFIENNNFTGKIPAEFANFKELDTVCMKNNRLSGEIPESLFSYPYWNKWAPEANIYPQQSGYGFTNTR